MRRLTLTTFLGLTLLTTASTALAAPWPKVTVAPRYGAALMPRSWQPVTVTVTNPKDGAAFNGEVLISQGADTWSTPIALPAGPSVATATLTIYESPQPWLPHAVSLRSSRGETRLNQSWSPAVKPERLVRVLVISDDGSAGEWESLNGQKSPVCRSKGRLIPAPEQGWPGYSGPTNDHYYSIVTATPNQLTESATDLDQFGVIVWNPGVKLTPGQEGAISRWNSAGGALIGPNTPSLNLGMLHVATVGAGRAVALTPGGYPQPLTDLIAPKNQVATWRSAAESEPVFSEVLHHSGVQPPPFSTIVLFLGAYLIVVVPLQYLVLRRLDKREWAWGTTPLLACGFATSAFVVGNQGRERELTYNCAALIETGAGQTTGAMVARMGLYSPQRATYSITAPTAESVFLSGMGEGNLKTTLTPGKPARLDDFSVPQWAVRSTTFYAPDLPLGGGVVADLHHGKEGLLLGTITNNTAFTLENVQVHFAGGRTMFARLSPGQTHKVTVAYPHESGNSYPVDTHTAVELSNFSYSHPPLYPLLNSFLQAWNDQEGYQPTGVQRTREAVVTAFTRDRVVPFAVRGGAARPKNTNSLLLVHVPVR